MHRIVKRLLILVLGFFGLVITTFVLCFFMHPMIAVMVSFGILAIIVMGFRLKREISKNGRMPKLVIDGGMKGPDEDDEEEEDDGPPLTGLEPGPLFKAIFGR